MNEKESEPPIEYCEDSPDQDIYNEIFRLIYKINKYVEKLQRSTVQENKLTPSQYLILRHLWDKNGRQFKELAEFCSCSRSTITGIVDTMEKNDLVKRTLNPKDRRSLLVKLTKKGKELEKIAPRLDAIVNNCCQGFDYIDLKKLGGLLQKFYKSLKY